MGKIGGAKEWAAGGGNGPYGYAYFELKSKAIAFAKAHGSKLRRFNKSTHTWDIVNPQPPALRG